MMPSHVYLTAYRLWVGTSQDITADETVLRIYADTIWSTKSPTKLATLILWVMSWAAQIGHE